MEKKSVELGAANCAVVIEALLGAERGLQRVVNALAGAGQRDNATFLRVCEMRDEVEAMSVGAKPALFL